MSNWERHEVLKISIMKKASVSSVNWSNNIVNHKIIITKQSNLIGNKTISLKENEEIPSRTMEGKTNGRKLLSMFIILSLKKVALMTDIQGNVIQKWSTEIITQSIKINSFRHIRMNVINAIHIFIHNVVEMNKQFIHNANTREINCFKASQKTPMFYSSTWISFKVLFDYFPQRKNVILCTTYK